MTKQSIPINNSLAQTMKTPCSTLTGYENTLAGPMNIHYLDFNYVLDRVIMINTAPLPLELQIISMSRDLTLGGLTELIKSDQRLQFILTELFVSYQVCSIQDNIFVAWLETNTYDIICSRSCFLRSYDGNQVRVISC